MACYPYRSRPPPGLSVFDRSILRGHPCVADTARNPMLSLKNKTGASERARLLWRETARKKLPAEQVLALQKLLHAHVHACYSSPPRARIEAPSSADSPATCFAGRGPRPAASPRELAAGAPIAAPAVAASSRRTRGSGGVDPQPEHQGLASGASEAGVHALRTRLFRITR